MAEAEAAAEAAAEATAEEVQVQVQVQAEGQQGEGTHGAAADDELPAVSPQLAGAQSDFVIATAAGRKAVEEEVRQQKEAEGKEGNPEAGAGEEKGEDEEGKMAGDEDGGDLEEGDMPQALEMKRQASAPVTKEEREAVRKDGGERRGVSKSGLVQALQKMTIPTPFGLMRLPSLGPTKAEEKETIYCQICMENVDVEDTIAPSGGPDGDNEDDAGKTDVADEEMGLVGGGSGCEHRFCRECVSGHLSVQITDGVVQHPCPIGDCEAQFSAADVKAVVSDEIWAKFERFVAMKKDKNHRDCPNCNKLILGNPRRPQMVCDACNTEFCFFHSNAHPNQSCGAYARELRRAEIQSKATIAATTYGCPQCKAPIEKNGGCNHMTCQACHHQYCYLCRRPYDYNHYSGGLCNPCSGMQFATGLSPANFWFYRIIVLVFGAIAAVGAVGLAFPWFVFWIWYAIFDDDDWDEKFECLWKPPFYVSAGLIAVSMFGVSVAWWAATLPFFFVIYLPFLAINGLKNDDTDDEMERWAQWFCAPGMWTANALEMLD